MSHNHWEAWRPGWISLAAVTALAVGGLFVGIQASLVFAWFVVVVIVLVAWVLLARLRRRAGNRAAGPSTWRWWVAPIVLVGSLALAASGVYGAIRFDLSRDALVHYATTVALEAPILSGTTGAPGMQQIDDDPGWIGLHEIWAIHRDGQVVDFEEICPACFTEVTGVLYDPTGTYFRDQPDYSESEGRGGYSLVADLGGGLYRYER